MTPLMLRAVLLLLMVFAVFLAASAIRSKLEREVLSLSTVKDQLVMRARSLEARNEQARLRTPEFPLGAGVQADDRIQAEISFQRLIMHEVEASALTTVSFGIEAPRSSTTLPRVAFELEAFGRLKDVAELLLALERVTPTIGVSSLWLRRANTVGLSESGTPVYLQLRLWTLAPNLSS